MESSGSTVYGGGGTGGLARSFALAPPRHGHSWTEYQLYNFGGVGAGGGLPFDGLTLGPDGSLYGVNGTGTNYGNNVTPPQRLPASTPREPHHDGHQ